MLSIEDFLEVMKSDNVGKSAVYNAKISLEQFNEFKPLDEAEYMDVVRFVNYIRDEFHYKHSTISLRKAYIKKYFKYHDRDDIVKKLEVKREPKHLNPNDIIGVEDMNYLIEHLSSPMYKAIITFLFESGARINEALSVKIDEDIKEHNIGYSLILYGDKTRKHNYAYREMYLIESAPYIREFIMLRNSSSPYLFPLKDKSVNEWLNNLRKTLNFKKPINPHAFRHACATRLVRKGMQESLIRKQMGWSPNSNMIATYVHLANTDLKTYQLMQSGEITEGMPVVELTKPKETVMDKVAQQEIKIEELNDTVFKLLTEMEEMRPFYRVGIDKYLDDNPDAYDDNSDIELEKKEISTEKFLEAQDSLRKFKETRRV
jgi:integrase/uncharacterized coiled-coil protein SlyX